MVVVVMMMMMMIMMISGDDGGGGDDGDDDGDNFDDGDYGGGGDDGGDDDDDYDDGDDGVGDDDDDEAGSLDWPGVGAPGPPPDVLLARGPARHPPPLGLSTSSRPLQEGSVCGEEWGGWRPGPLLSPLPSRLVSAGGPGGEAQV